MKPSIEASTLKWVQLFSEQESENKTWSNCLTCHAWSVCETHKAALSHKQTLLKMILNFAQGDYRMLRRQLWRCHATSRSHHSLTILFNMQQGNYHSPDEIVYPWRRESLQPWLPVLHMWASNATEVLFVRMGRDVQEIHGTLMHQAYRGHVKDATPLGSTPHKVHVISRSPKSWAATWGRQSH